MIYVSEKEIIMLLNKLEKVTDPRSYHGREYKLHHVLYFCILALLSNAKTYKDIHRFIKGHFDDLKELFDLKWRQPPGESALRKIIVRLSSEEIESVFQADAHDLSSLKMDSREGSFRQVCFDGKALRGSFSHIRDKRAQGVFSAFSACKNIVLAHIPLSDGKTHEICAMQEFLEKLDLKDVIVTADAIHCQKKHLRTQRKPKPSS